MKTSKNKIHLNLLYFDTILKILTHHDKLRLFELSLMSE